MGGKRVGTYQDELPGAAHGRGGHAELLADPLCGFQLLIKVIRSQIGTRALSLLPVVQRPQQYIELVPGEIPPAMGSVGPRSS